MAPSDFRDIPNNAHPLWYKDPGLRWNVFHGLGLCLVIATNGYAGSLLGGFQAIPAWQKYFHSPVGTRLGLYAAAFFLPSTFTAYIGDYVADRFGRRPCVILGVTLMLIGSIINTIASNTGMWVAGRAVIGAGTGIVKPGAPVLIQEIAHPRYRTALGSLYQSFAYLGGFTAALMCFAGLYFPSNWSWRIPSVLQVLGPIAIILVTLHCPESPRWLAKQGRLEEAQRILAKYHANGKMDDPLVLFQMSNIQAALEREEISKRTSYVDFLRTPGNRRRLLLLVMLALSLNWMGNGIISYYLVPILKTVGITKPVQTTLINAGLALMNIFCAVGASLSADRVGRKPLFLTSIAGMLTMYAIVMGLSAGFAKTKQQSLGVAVVPMLYLYFAFYTLAFTPLPIAYTVEILPFGIRTKGMALFTSIATLGNAFNQFVNPIALKAIAWKYYGVYIVILSFYGIMFYFFLPETKGVSMDRINFIFDGPDAAEPRDHVRQQTTRSLDSHDAEADVEEKERDVHNVEHYNHGKGGRVDV